MAKIKMSPLVTDIKGSTDRLLFSSSRGVATVRTKKSPVQPNTAAQIKSRGALYDLMTLWKTLSSSARTIWEVYAKGMSMTPVNAFLAQNLALENTTNRWSMFPPGSIPAISASGFYESEGCANVPFAFTPGSIPSGQTILVWHRMGNTPGPPAQVWIRYAFGGPLSSPVSVPVVNCGGGDNFLYAALVTPDWTAWSYGFGVFVDVL